jgi:DNA-binding MarR family transcriptional regulator
MTGMGVADRPDVAAWRAVLYANDQVLKRLAEDMSREQGLELTWYEVLMQLVEASGPVSQRDLLDHALVSQSGLSRILTKMQDAGLVRRLTLESDRRNLLVEITECGRDRARRAAAVYLAGVQKWFGDPLTGRQLDAVRVSLQRVLRNLADSSHPSETPQPVAIGPAMLSLSADAMSTADAIVVRDAIEPLILADAVRYVTVDDVADLRRLLSAMARQMDSPVDFLRADWALHRRIAEISPNAVLRQVYDSLVLTIATNVDSIEPDDGHPDYLRQRLQLHADIVETIAESDAEGAAVLAERHRLTSAVSPRSARRDSA